MRKLDARLVGGNEGEDVLVRILVDPFENGQVGHHSSGVEVFEAIEDDVIAIVNNVLVVVARIDCTAHKMIILVDKLLSSVLLLIGPHNVGGPGPEQVVAEKHTNGSVSFSNFTNHLVAHFPALFATTIFGGTKHSGESGGFEKGNLCQRRLILLVSDGGILG